MTVAPRKLPKPKPRASWASNRIVESGKLAKTVYSGVFLDAGLEDAFDYAAEDAGWIRGTIKHQSKSKYEENKVRDHWLLPGPCKAHFLIDSLPSWENGKPLSKVFEYVQAGVWEYGIGARWPQATGQHRSRSALGVFCLFNDLLFTPEPYYEPISFVVTSSYTDDLITQMIRHQKVVDHANNLSKQAGKKKLIRFCDLAIPLAPGKQITRGKGDLTNDVLEISSAHPHGIDQWDAGYLKTLLPPQGVSIYDHFVYHIDQGVKIHDWADNFAQELQQA